MSLLADFSNDAASLADRVSPRVVSVRAGNGGQSSGFVWRTGLVVTADEALDGEDEVELLFADGKTVKAAIVGRDPSTDVTLVKAETAEFGEWEAATARPAALALVAGRGDGSLLASLASITEVGPAWRSMRGGQIDARISLAVRLGGRSEGAVVVTPDGQLLGMAVSSPRRRTLVIPNSTISRAVATLAEKGYIPRGWLGVMLHPVGSGAGAILLGVEADSPAAKAGLLVGDVITTWDGDAVKSVGSISNRLATGTVGSVVKLGVLRGGSAIDISVTLGERPRG